MKTDPIIDDPGSRAGTFFRDVMIVLVAALVTRLAGMLVIPDGSIDAHSWETVARSLAAGENPYHTTSVLNWPPFWLQIIFVLSKVAAVTHVPFFHVLQLFLTLMELLVIIALAGLIRQIDPSVSIRTVLLVGLALNPAAILLTCQHCNFDVIVGLWVVLFVRSLVRYRSTNDSVDWLYACFFLGLGIVTKTVPLVLVPMLAGGFRHSCGRLRLLGMMFLWGPVALGMSVLFVLCPSDVVSKIIEYRSLPGYFGFSGVFQMAGLDGLMQLFAIIFYGLLLAAGIGSGVLFWRRRAISSRATVLLPALLLISVPALGPGYGPQYLYWSMPLLVASFAIFDRRWRWLLAGFAAVVAITYLFEYALYPPYGMSLLRLLGDAKQAAFWTRLSQQWTPPPGQTMVLMPLFLYYLVLLLCGIRRLFREIDPVNGGKSS